MSWSGHYQGAMAVDVAMADFGVNPGTAEGIEQFKAARAAAATVIASGALGSPRQGRAFDVDLRGHANVGHEPAPGSANELVMITVSQVTVATPTEG